MDGMTHQMGAISYSSCRFNYHAEQPVANLYDINVNSSQILWRCHHNQEHHVWVLPDGLSLVLAWKIGWSVIMYTWSQSFPQLSILSMIISGPPFLLHHLNDFSVPFIIGQPYPAFPGLTFISLYIRHHFLSLTIQHLSAHFTLKGWLNWRLNQDHYTASASSRRSTSPCTHSP